MIEFKYYEIHDHLIYTRETIDGRTLVCEELVGTFENEPFSSYSSYEVD